ncbi:NACHT domain-containing protein [Micromonospora carbonacea]|uniref:NACHT domain-containing protein n=1 Tax=Micromonospora carbonacea TaxID=47853 RepID=UPI003405E374
MRATISYSQALKILARDDVRISKLDRVLGGVLLAAAPLTAGASLALIDPKTEVVALIRELTNTTPGRIKNATGRQYYELIEAAHTVLGITAFFEAFRQELGELGNQLAITDSEKRQLAARSVQNFDGLSRNLNGSHFPLPSATRGFMENQKHIRARFEDLFIATLAFVEGLDAWEASHCRPTVNTLRQQVVDRAMASYSGHFVRLAADIPEFAQWINLSEHTATRSIVKDHLVSIEDSQREQAGALESLYQTLGKMTSRKGRVRDVEEKLSRKFGAVLEQAIWRSEVEGLNFPSVNAGFVSPGFRLAVADKDAKSHQDDWWDRQERREDLASFLATYVSSPSSVQRPLVILGHPGAGKTLLSEVIAARLPQEAYTPVIVRLRRVDADADVHQQIEAALESDVRERVSWGSFCRDSSTTKVLIFDGLDELIQATGVAQTSYIEKIGRFQEDEWRDGHAVVPIVTSRVLVMDRVRVPKGVTLIKLDHFSDYQVSNWAKKWNQANAETAGFRPLAPDELLHHGDLARQPLLLFLLAIYAAENRLESLRSEELSGAELYKRLLDSFILRQIREKARSELSLADLQRRQAILRRDLSIAAFAMFNRGKQSVSEDDLSSDLRALSSAQHQVAQAEFGEPVGRAKSTVAAFFFIHVDRAGEHDEDGARHSYEFLHATFGEYLVAEYAVDLLRDLAQDFSRLKTRMFAEPLEDRVYRALLAHQPLLKRQPVVQFAKEIVSVAPEGRIALRDTALELFRNARDKKGYDLVEGYVPTHYDPLTRLAAYTANMVTLAAVAAHPDPVPVQLLSETSAWESTVKLWTAGLDKEGRESVFAYLDLIDTGLIVFAEEAKLGPLNIELAAARLAGDIVAESFVEVGQMSWQGGMPANRFQKEVHLRLVQIVASRWPVPVIARVTPYDESLYEQLLQAATKSSDPIAEPSARIILTCLIDDGPHLPRDLVTNLATLAAENLPDVNDFYALPVLLFRCPYLAEVEAFSELLSTGNRNLLTLFLKRKVSALMPPSVPAQRRALPDPGLGPDRVHTTTVAPDMVKEFKDGSLPGPLVLGILESLKVFDQIVWPQVEPGDLLEMIIGVKPLTELWKVSVSKIVANYLEVRGVPATQTGYHSVVAALASYAETCGERVSLQ